MPGTAVAVAQRIHKNVVEIAIELHKVRSHQARPDDEKIAGPTISEKCREIGHGSQCATRRLAVRLGDSGYCPCVEQAPRVASGREFAGAAGWRIPE